jgi:predicted small secreted protein
VEYFIGAITTLITAAVVFIYLKRSAVVKSYRPLITQSKSFESVMNVLQSEFIKPKMITQATKHDASKYNPVAFYENTAYWIENNVFYCAEMNEDGAIVVETKQVVDTINADSIKLDLLTFIVEKLTEGKRNDSRNSGN